MGEMRGVGREAVLADAWAWQRAADGGPAVIESLLLHPPCAHALNAMNEGVLPPPQPHGLEGGGPQPHVRQGHGGRPAGWVIVLGRLGDCSGPP